MLSHLARQMGQHFMLLAYLNFEGSIAHAFDYRSIDRNHIFFRNDNTSFIMWRRPVGPRTVINITA